MTYLRRRVIHSLLLLVAVSLLSFALASLAPGEFFDEARLDPRLSREAVAAIRKAYGLDQPVAIRYLRWLGSVSRGDLGFSVTYMSPVTPLVIPRTLNTLLLSGIATVMAWAVAVPIGVWCADRQGRWDERLVGVATSGLLALPELVVAQLLLLVAVRTGWLPAGGMTSPAFASLSAAGKALDVGRHLLLPLLALVAAALPTLVRHVRASMLDVLGAPHVRAARALGIPRPRLLFRHALPAAANPLVSLFGFSVAALLSGSLLVEVVVQWPGLGPLFLQAILARDLHLVMAPVLLSTVLLLAGNLAADLLLYAADPRIRKGEGA